MKGRNKHTDLTDEQLLQRYQYSRDNEWLGYLLPRYTTLLLGVAMKYLKDRDAAEDAVQQIFLKTLTQIPTEEIQNFKGWLYVLMRNHCLQMLRDKVYNAPDDALQTLAAGEDARAELEWKDFTLEQMNRALIDLNTEQRQAIEMFYLQKKSYQEICDQTGYSFMQVKSYIQNGKRNLKLILTKRLGNKQP